MEFNSWVVLYFTPLFYMFAILLLTMISKRFSKVMGLQNWEEFSIVAFVSFVPAFNILVAIAATANFLPSIDKFLPTPRGWKRP